MGHGYTNRAIPVHYNAREIWSAIRTLFEDLSEMSTNSLTNFLGRLATEVSRTGVLVPENAAKKVLLARFEADARDWRRDFVRWSQLPTCVPAPRNPITKPIRC